MSQRGYSRGVCVYVCVYHDAKPHPCRQHSMEQLSNHMHVHLLCVMHTHRVFFLFILLCALAMFIVGGDMAMCCALSAMRWLHLLCCASYVLMCVCTNPCGALCCARTAIRSLLARAIQQTKPNAAGSKPTILYEAHFLQERHIGFIYNILVLYRICDFECGCVMHFQMCVFSSGK